MSDRRATPAEAFPRGLRVVLHGLIIVGVFAMHNLLLNSEGGHTAHHESSPMSSAAEAVHSSAADVVLVAQAAVGSGDGSQGSMSDCGGLMALCLAMVIGVSAYIVLSKRAGERVLWQRPPPLGGAFAAVPAFNCRSPLERSSILRC